MQNQGSERPYSSQQAPKLGGQTAARVPQRGLGYALIAGVLAGVLDALFAIAITLLNTGTFQKAASEGKNVTVPLALSVVGTQCFSFLLGLFIFLIAGYIVGTIAVRRRLGFLAGALAGAIVYLASFLVRYIPNYPGNTATSGLTNGSTLAISLVFLLITAIIGGLMGLLGAWIATRRHPYYTKYTL